MTVHPNYFQLLGVEQRYHLADDQLERNYHERSREHHPDRHVKSDSATRVKSALATSELNQAYRTLRDPVRRAEYLLALEGIVLGDEKSTGAVDPEFLMEILELREALTEARSESDEPKIAALGADVRERRTRAMASTDDGFTRLEAGDRSKLGEIAAALIALRYYRRFLDELEAHEEAENLSALSERGPAS